MKNLIRKIISLGCLAGVIIAFSLPKLYFQWSDLKTLNKAYAMEAIDYRLESKSEDILQVANLFSLYNDSFSFAIYPESYVEQGENELSYQINHETAKTQKDGRNLVTVVTKGKIGNLKMLIEKENNFIGLALEQLHNLQKKGIITDSVLSLVKDSQVALTVTNGNFFYARWGTSEKYLGVILDLKTDKIIKILDKTGIDHEKIQKKQFLAYINYLNLGIINNWSYEGNILNSKTAGLKVVFMDDNEMRELSILPTSIPLYSNKDF